VTAAGRWARPVLAANWKMNLGPDEARQFIAAFTAQSPAPHKGTVIFFPPDVSLTAAHEAARTRPDLRFGAQNVYWEDKGAFTGETSAPLARAAGAAFVLVGHSERRHVFGETDEETGRKCEAVARAGLTPVLCVGETLGQREAGETEAVVLSPSAFDELMNQAELAKSLAVLDRSMEEVKAGRGQPLKQAIREIAAELGLKIDR